MSGIKPANDEDGSFLIIDDSVTAASIPDTAVQLFEETPTAPTETIQESGDSLSDFLSAAKVMEVTEEDEVAQEDEAEVIEATTVIETIAEELPAIPEVEATPILSFVEVTSSSTGDDMSTSGATAQDPDDILKKAIQDLEILRLGHAKLAEAQDSEIELQNARVAEAKNLAKKALEERKKIETEIARVDQMKALFTSQLGK